ncbi:hypothetical protein KO494_08940 [Lacinutrix sp. C3R15]|nr:hypothetical protein [Lacinutrix sp. C3R15]MDO6622977.1 hypothetical protein [Oceanihabitans sp. 1_MG-2023]
MQSKIEYPIIAAVAAGLFPFVFYYSRNFTLINSWSQFLYFLVYFLVIPIVVFKLAYLLCNKISFFKPAKKFALPFLNFSWATYLLIHVSIGFRIKIIFISILLVLLATFLLYKYFNKVIVFQFVLAIVSAISFLNFFVFNVKNSQKWLVQPDAIEEVVFKKKPNIYLIQPDGYANISELNTGYYNFDNSQFETYLQNKDFKIYADYRSNYYSTLSSNSSLFAMKHHYHNAPVNKVTELYNARDVIVGENPVLKILKNNNYKTHLLLDKSYLLYNRPKLFYDTCNISLKELPFFSKWLAVNKDVLKDFKTNMSINKEANNFYFIEQMSPSHITNRREPGDIAKSEREKYLSKLEETNIWLKQIIDYISAKDKNSLIIIAADHGGFVGMNTTKESLVKSEERDLVYSIFTSQLAIKWPENTPEFDAKLKTPVNLFRILFSYLSENESYLENLQEDKSYTFIEKGAPFGVYELINEKGEVVFKELSK